jgi:hypothetical protein
MGVPTSIYSVLLLLPTCIDRYNARVSDTLIHTLSCPIRSLQISTLGRSVVANYAAGCIHKDRDSCMRGMARRSDRFRNSAEIAFMVIEKDSLPRWSQGSC